MSNDLRERVERLERELGIDPEQAKFKEYCEDAAFPGVKLDGVDPSNYVAVWDISDGFLKDREVRILQRNFRSVQVDAADGKVKTQELAELEGGDNE